MTLILNEIIDMLTGIYCNMSQGSNIVLYHVDQSEDCLNFQNVSQIVCKLYLVNLSSKLINYKQYDGLSKMLSFLLQSILTACVQFLWLISHGQVGILVQQNGSKIPWLPLTISDFLFVCPKISPPPQKKIRKCVV